jgi:NAD(P)-dependent dehydrogenase (short-subunit alcohol dehydrogenase family)
MSDQGSGRVALIVGASRGLGLGLVQRHLERGWSVIATVRGPSPGLEALNGGSRLRIETLDITCVVQIDALAARLAGTRLDLLFVNAGILDHRDRLGPDTPDEDFAHLMLTNALAPVRVIARLGGLVPPDGVVAAMSSGLGSVANNRTAGNEAYRASKAALNTLLRSVAVRDAASGRTYLAVDPGWVKTDMGGAEAMLDVATSTAGIADMLESRRGRGGSWFVTYRDSEVAW